ncbi:MAG: hypothetical protein LBQ23_01140 [Puniceicoccales bacterium]|jgi:hypothetical protein|nr:hypothetical protein [Puniceicoccales bacterium]
MKLTKLILAFILLSQPHLVGENFESLITNSPFAGQTSGISSSSNKSSKSADIVEINYELRGILIKDNIRVFNIYNQVDGRYKWVKQGDGRGQIVIDSFDEYSKTLYFHTSDGKSYAVRLKNTLNSLNALGITFK